MWLLCVSFVVCFFLFLFGGGGGGGGGVGGRGESHSLFATQRNEYIRVYIYLNYKY